MKTTHVILDIIPMPGGEPEGGIVVNPEDIGMWHALAMTLCGSMPKEYMGYWDRLIDALDTMLGTLNACEEANSSAATEELSE